MAHRHEAVGYHYESERSGPTRGTHFDSTDVCRWSSISSPSSQASLPRVGKARFQFFFPKDEVNGMRIAMASRLWLNDSLSVMSFVDEACVCAWHHLRWNEHIDTR